MAEEPGQDLTTAALVLERLRGLDVHVPAVVAASPFCSAFPPAFPAPPSPAAKDWMGHRVTAPVPAHAYQVEFDLTLIGPGQVAMRNVTGADAS